MRAAAFAAVRQLREKFGGRIPRSALFEGVSVNGVRVKYFNYMKGIHKPAEFGLGGAALSIHTSWNSPYGDRHDAAIGTICYKYQGKDPMGRDNVALRRAMELGLPLIYFVAVNPATYDVIAPVYVQADDPASLEFTLVADQVAYVGQPDDPTRTSIRREYATRAVLQRLHQREFRRVVLAAYRRRCSICSLKHLELLDAAHILPDRDPTGDPVVTNGIGLCKIHHSAYDANILGIDPDAIVHIREDILREVDGPMLKHGLQAMAGRRLLLPSASSELPNREFLAERFGRFRAA